MKSEGNTGNIAKCYAPTSPKKEQQTVGVELALPKNPLPDYNMEKGSASYAPTSPKKEQQSVGVELALPKENPETVLKKGRAISAPTSPKENPQTVFEKGRASSAPTSPKEEQQTVGVELALPQNRPAKFIKKWQCKLCPYVFLTYK